MDHDNNPYLKQLFDRAAQSYDQSRRYLIPQFDDFYAAILRQIPFTTEENFRCLDLGAGTGLLAAFVAAVFPHAQLTLLDLSDTMLEKARQRFAGSRQGVFIQMDYRHSDPAGRYQVIVSALSIHHLEAPEKIDLFRRLMDWLEPGGVFVNGDQVLGPTPEIEAAYHAAWLEFVQASPISPEAYEAAMSRLSLDRFSTLADQLAWLEQAGFEDVRCEYQHNRFVVYAAHKPLITPLTDHRPD